MVDGDAELDAIFAERNRRDAEEARKRHEAAEKERVFWEDFERLRDTVIVPVLTDIASRVKDRGVTAVVELRPEDLRSPGAVVASVALKIGNPAPTRDVIQFRDSQMTHRVEVEPGPGAYGVTQLTEGDVESHTMAAVRDFIVSS